MGKPSSRGFSSAMIENNHRSSAKFKIRHDQYRRSRTVDFSPLKCFIAWRYGSADDRTHLLQPITAGIAGKSWRTRKRLRGRTTVSVG